MIITAKFASTCPVCGARISTGEKVEWAKGSPARHVRCATTTTTSSAARKTTTTSSAACDECGARGATHHRRDSSGIPGVVCYRCSTLSCYELSFA